MLQPWYEWTDQERASLIAGESQLAGYDHDDQLWYTTTYAGEMPYTGDPRHCRHTTLCVTVAEEGFAFGGAYNWDYILPADKVPNAKPRPPFQPDEDSDETVG